MLQNHDLIGAEMVCGVGVVVQNHLCVLRQGNHGVLLKIDGNGELFALVFPGEEEIGVALPAQDSEAAVEDGVGALSQRQQILVETENGLFPLLICLQIYFCQAAVDGDPGLRGGANLSRIKFI